MLVPSYSQYQEEKQKWKEAGEPLRSPEKIQELFNICNSCEHKIVVSPRILQCGICTCLLRPQGNKANKLAYATTRCPLEEAKWVEEPGYEQKKAEPEAPAQPQFNSRKPKNAGGGCGCS